MQNVGARATLAVLALVAGVVAWRPAVAAVAVKPPFASSMVLQREMVVPIWGSASSGEQVTVSIAGQTKTVTTPSTGKWTVRLDPMPAGGPYSMAIKGTNTVTLNDVYVGEVWQAAGQSNMDTRLNFYSNLASEISRANYPLLRYYTLRQPGETTTWEIVAPSTAGPLSALAYFFGKEIQQKTGLAVGLVVTAVGGTTIASWLDPATLVAHPEVSDSDRGSMWNSWVAPVTGYAIRGTIWFQGEQNTNSTDVPTYGQRFDWLIRGWRAAWAQGDFPFFYGQLSNIHAAQTDPNNVSNVAPVREGQRMVLGLPNTAMSVNIDIGIADNWHFPNKPEAGRRLSLPARARIYGESSLVHSGPLYVSKTVSGGKVTLHFQSVGGGLVARDGGALQGFAIAGASGAWTWGDAAISGDTVIVSSAAVPTPTRVRYAWGDNPVFSLYNQEGLPASPFSTESPDLVPNGSGGMGGAGGTGGGGAGGSAGGGRGGGGAGGSAGGGRGGDGGAGGSSGGGRGGGGGVGGSSGGGRGGGGAGGTGGAPNAGGASGAAGAPTGGAGGAVGDPSDAGATGNGGGMPTAGAGGAGGTAAAGVGGNAVGPPGAVSGDSGCACRVGGERAFDLGGTLALVLLGAITLARRRRGGAS